MQNSRKGATCFSRVVERGLSKSKCCLKYMPHLCTEQIKSLDNSQKHHPGCLVWQRGDPVQKTFLEVLSQIRAFWKTETKITMGLTPS